MVFNTEPYTVLPDNSILNTANMQSETSFPSSHQLKSYVASKSRLKLAARTVLSADAGLLVRPVYALERIRRTVWLLWRRNFETKQNTRSAFHCGSHAIHRNNSDFEKWRISAFGCGKNDYYDMSANIRVDNLNRC